MLHCLRLLAMEALNYTAPVIFKTETADAVAVFTREVNMKTFFWLVGGALLLSGVCTWAAPRLPVEAFAAPPLVQRATLSPDGQKVAMLVNNQGTSMILVQDLGPPGKRVSIMSSDNREYSFRWLRWVGNDRLLVATMFPSKRRIMWDSNVGGVATYETRLLSAKADGSKVINLMKPNSFQGELQPQYQDQVLDFEPDNGKHVLLALSDPPKGNMEKTSFNLGPAVVSLDVESGTRSHIFNSRDNFRSWMVDRSHQVRLGVYQDKTLVEIHACDPDGKNWRKLWSYQALSKDRLSPLGFGKDANELYLLADHEGRRALFSVDLRDPTLQRTLKLADRHRDMEGSLVYSRKTGEVVGLTGSGEVDKAQDAYWDKDKRELVSFIDSALPNRFNRIVSMSDDESRYIVYSSNAQTPGEFYLGDERTNSMVLFASRHPGLNSKDMVTKQGFKIKARDGLELPAFLSLPQGMEPKNLPTVLLVHGGPQSHDDASFSTWVQFLVNRGYAVLQVNFRGSTGYGSELMQAGLRRWGMEVQDDLSDATQWAVARGTSDPRRVCIVGASFGGYAALMGVAKSSDLYRCAVSFAGVSDLAETLQDTEIYRDLREVAAIQIGSREKDTDQLRATSPRYLASQIKVPVLLVHGTEDRSVPFYQAELMDQALSAAGKTYRFVKQERGDHYLSRYEHSLQFFTELESFLAQNIGDGALPAK